MDRRHRNRLVIGSSTLALSMVLATAPASAQMANLRSSLGLPTAIPPTVLAPAPQASVITPSMRALMTRAASAEARVTNNAALIAQVNAAARAAARAVQQTVPNGLGVGGLDPVAGAVAAAQDATGLATWQGAARPVQTSGTAGPVVTITQTDSRALLSWNSFNVGRDTTLVFDQKVGGVAQPNWVAVNRVVSGIDPRTGIADPNIARPSQILGSIRADGTVAILNQAGVLFSPTAQVNLHSLLVSSLELGAGKKGATSPAAATIADRNTSFLQNGFNVQSVNTLVSAIYQTSAGASPRIDTEVSYGAVRVDRGAQIASAGAGFVILTAPSVSSDGSITADAGGQVSLQAGLEINSYVSSGSATSIDPNVRGQVLTTSIGSAAVFAGDVRVGGLIDAPQGYVSLGTSQTGTVELSGVVTSTTSVSRNGKVSLTGGTVTLARDAVIAVRPDGGTATIPQSAESVAAFKVSQIDIGSMYEVLAESGATSLSALLPGRITLDSGSLILAPSATVNLGGKTAVNGLTGGALGYVASGIDILAGATIDVSGVTDLLLSAARNSLAITPAKRNELRDTPTYRDVTTDGSFTLNGATLYVDPRISGVRADGVAWVGSPLLEAGSLAGQTGITAAELMTKGGKVTMVVNSPLATERGNLPRINIAAGATVDMSGGWVHYQQGLIRTSRLLGADGNIVDISEADPNDVYVAVSGSFTEKLPQLANGTTFASDVLDGVRLDAEYIEGRDAGSLTVVAPVATLDGDLFAQAFAGARQLTGARLPSRTSPIGGDVLPLQSQTGELPSGGLLHVLATAAPAETDDAPGGSIVIAAASQVPAVGNAMTLLTDARLSNPGFSGIVLQTTGGVVFTAGSDVNLVPGAALRIDAGRSIQFAGDISAPGGSIVARTYNNGSGEEVALTAAQRVLIAGGTAPRLFDIIVDGTLSTAGRWINDSTVIDGRYAGSSYTDGGSVSLTVAPRAAALTGPNSAIDLSGSIFVNAGGQIDVSSGGYVTPSGTLSLVARGGDVSLVNQTLYFQFASRPGQASPAPFLGGLSTFQVTPDAAGAADPVSAVVPEAITSQVSIAPGTITGFGFGGGGTFSLVAPRLGFGSSDSAAATILPTDFIQQMGFANYDLSAWRTEIFANVFSNGLTGNTAVLATERFVIGANQVLDLTQRVFPSLLTRAQQAGLLTLATDSAVASVLAPAIPTSAFDRLAANLTLGGLTELDVRAGGQVIGAAGAALTVPRLYNDGTIRIAGGSIVQQLILPSSYVGPRAAIAVDGIGSLSDVFGPATNGLFDENLVKVRSDGQAISNRDLVAGRETDRQIYFLGEVDAANGVELTARSITDLSGTTILDPRATLLAGGVRQVTGRLVDGGSLRLLGTFNDLTTQLFSVPAFGVNPFRTSVLASALSGVARGRSAVRLAAATGARINISGATAAFDVLAGGVVQLGQAQWSNAGTLSLLGGGSIDGAVIDAHGGTAAAVSGTLEWLNPVLVATDTSGIANSVSAGAITAAGFGSVVARGVLSSSGDVTLGLGRSFALRSIDYDGTVEANNYGIAITGSGNLTVAAPYIGFASIVPNSDRLLAAPTVGPATATATFRAGTIDVAGSVPFGQAFSQVILDATGDIRLIGAPALQQTLAGSFVGTPTLGGRLLTGGDLLLRAAQIYATTGTGSLQAIANGGTATPFLIASSGADATIRFARSGTATPATPYSAGSYLVVQAANIEQAGVLRAPIGRIDLGTTTPLTVSVGGFSQAIPFPTSVTFEAGSVTSVSAAGLRIPYGTTTDLAEYYFNPTSSAALAAPPAAELRMAGGTITVAPGATIDGSGGGDLFAYEFVSGVGGSRDVLDRLNGDAFSSLNGLQFPDGRQVYAIVPGLSAAAVAAVDPIYSANYASLYGGDAGRTVFLSDVPGLVPGNYTLLPAHYALLPGGFRVVENIGAGAPALGSPVALLDGGVIVAGQYGVAQTSLRESTLRSFNVQSSATFLRYSNIQLTNGNTSFTNLATKAGRPVPQLPLDSARVVLSPVSGLIIGERLVTAPATGGRGAKVDIAAARIDPGAISQIDIITAEATAREGVLTLRTTDLANLGASSLLIGGIRTDLADGSTNLSVSTQNIRVATSAADPLRAPELVLAVDGIRSTLEVADGSSIVAAGAIGDGRTGDYNIAVAGNSGAGSVLRVASGDERLINRTGEPTDAAAGRRSTLTIGAAAISGNALAFETSRDMTIDKSATFDASLIAVAADSISFAERGNAGGVLITQALETMLAGADRLTLRSPNVIGFAPGTHRFNDLILNSQGVHVLRPQGVAASEMLAVSINADQLTLLNTAGDRGDCTPRGTLFCGASGNTLAINANQIAFGNGVVRIYGFDGAVGLRAANGVYYEGVGTFDVGNTALTLTTPFIADRALAADPRRQAVQPSLTLATTGAVTIAAAAGVLAQPTGLAAPGARLVIGGTETPVASLSIDNTLLRATAGTIELRSTGNLALSGTAQLATPGFSRLFGEAADQVRVSAPGGALNLVSLGGNVSVGSQAQLTIGGGIGQAGTLLIAADQGLVTLGGTIDAAAPGGGASLVFDSGLGGFDFAGFVRSYGTQFSGDIAVRTGIGNLTLDAGQTLVARSLSLTADDRAAAGGMVRIGGRIDTSGTNGGDVQLFGANGVTLAAGAVIDAHAAGYGATDSRQAGGGDVTLGTAGTGRVTIAAGATIDVGARQSGARLVPLARKDPLTLVDVTAYSYVGADQGGTVTLRAPVIAGAGGANSVDIIFGGAIAGASRIDVEGYRVYDLGELAGNAAFTGVSIIDGQAILDLNASAAGRVNVLAERSATGLGTIVDFVQTFDLAGATGLGTLAGNPLVHLRPGVELQYLRGNGRNGDIVLASNWNLGAGGITDTAGALTNGGVPLIRLSALGNDAAGQPRYEVIPGREAELFQKYVGLTYRTGGGRIDGEAPILTFRAGGDLDIRRSISDGFFSFGDQTDPDFISFQLGGGARTFGAVVEVVCGAGASADNCGAIAPYPLDLPLQQVDPGQGRAINIRLTNILRGPATLLEAAPYSALANAPGAVGTGAGGSGDPLGSAQLFPLLANDGVVASSSYRFTAGAGSLASANPLHVDRVTGGSVSVSGEQSYQIVATPRSGSYQGDLLFTTNHDPASPRSSYFTSNLLANLIAATGLDGSDPGEPYLGSLETRLIIGFGTDQATSDLRSAAASYFSGTGQAVDFINPFQPSGLVASLASVVGFLESAAPGDPLGRSVAQRFGAQLDGSSSVPPPQPGPIKQVGGNVVRVPTLVRTGIGSISIAAAGDVDLRQNGDTITMRNAGSNGRVQVGGSAVYTAGHLVVPQAVTATVTTTGERLTVDPGAYRPAATPGFANYLPNPNGVLLTTPVYADGGGDISVSAGRDVLATRDVYGEAFGAGEDAATSVVGTPDQRWRVGLIGVTDSQANSQTTLTSNIRTNAQRFTSGIGTLGGGDVLVAAGRTIGDLTIALDTTLTTADIGTSFGSMTFGGGRLVARAGGDIVAGRFDVASGEAMIAAGGSIASGGPINLPTTFNFAGRPVIASAENALAIRLTDAAVTVSAAGTVTLSEVAALGVRTFSSGSFATNGTENANGLYTAASALSVLANGSITLLNNAVSSKSAFLNAPDPSNPADATAFVGDGAVLPASFAATSLTGDLSLANGRQLDLYPSPIGQLQLFAGGTIAPMQLAMEDGDPSLLPGLFSALVSNAQGPIQGRRFGLPIVTPATREDIRRLLHNSDPTHLGDSQPIRIAADGDLENLALYLPKQARISSGRDIVNMVFNGQNLDTGDVTRITAARDIIGQSALTNLVGSTATPQPALLGNIFVLGGPGALMIEAGRDLGPFLTSATASVRFSTTGELTTADFAGGILTVGNDYNPWLSRQGASIYTAFGVSKGADYVALRDAYLDPANVAALDDDLFAQSVDRFGNTSPDRTRPIYGPGLVAWMLERAPDALAAAFGSSISIASSDVLPLLASLDPALRNQFLVDLPYLPQGGILSQQVAVDRTARATPTLVTDAAQVAAAPAAQRGYISGSTLIGWLAQNAQSVLTERYAVTSTSIAGVYAQFVRLDPLRQRQALLDSVYFNELASTSRPDGASYLQYIRGYRAVDALFPATLGYTANDLSGAGNGGTRVLTGNLDLRLATIQSGRGGDVTLLAPGGNAILGSVVATSAQAARRYYSTAPITEGRPAASPSYAISAIPIGYEGVLTLRGGAIRSFTDGDVRLNQSRLFSQSGGDLVLWSSNGDLNAGQGPKTSANFPPVTVRFDLNFGSEVDSAGSVSGAGIAAFQPSPEIAAPSVTLIAPVGTVDAGDAGVRAAGNVFVAAAQVANADNFQVGGQAIGVPSLATTTAPVTPAAAAAAIVANVFRATNNQGLGDDRTRISVDVLGFFGESTNPCEGEAAKNDPNCPAQPQDPATPTP